MFIQLLLIESGPLPNLVSDHETEPSSVSRDAVGSVETVSYSCTTSANNASVVANNVQCANPEQIAFSDEDTSVSNNSHTVCSEPDVTEASTLVGSRKRHLFLSEKTPTNYQSLRQRWKI